MKYKLLVICALFLSINAVKADEVITIHFNNASTENINILDIKKITFDESGLTVFSETNNYFDYTSISKITFNEGVGIESILADNTSIVVAPNPTKNYLMINGADNLYGSDLYIYSISGAVVSKQAGWYGERVDVSNLNSGIYFVRIGSTTSKFVKQ